MNSEFYIFFEQFLYTLHRIFFLAFFSLQVFSLASEKTNYYYYYYYYCSRFTRHAFTKITSLFWESDINCFLKYFLFKNNFYLKIIFLYSNIKIIKNINLKSLKGIKN